ncbi:MAG: MBL fold metallo-hydrolase [Candidatus Helarchaeota archaeon]
MTFIGTGGSSITEERNGVSILIDSETLIDCSEGTAKRLIKLKKIKDLKEILITHFHLDHSIGIFSILWYYWLISNRIKHLNIYGPSNTENFVENILKLTETPRNAFPYEIKYHEFKEPNVMKINDISALHVVHHIETLAYRIDRKKTVCYTSDTGPFEKIVEFVRNSDLLIHDVSVSLKNAEWAHKYNHCTSKDAAINARDAKVKILAMVHIMPQAEKDKNLLLKEAREYFDGEIFLMEDLSEIHL